MQTIPFQKTDTRVIVNDFIRSVYNWMGIGLGLTGFIAYYVAHNQAMKELVYGNKLMFFGLFIAELALVFTLSSRINRMSASAATGFFLLYSILNGATLSFIFLVYTSASISSTFLICSATFVACSAYGMITKRDLTSFGGFISMGLIGIVIASLVNLFLKSPAVYMAVSYIGVFIFVGLTAYDTQKLKHMALTQPAELDSGAVRKGAILGALSLYLDFINLFLMLLRILGSSRD
ncbi:MAG: Bax inhibitor-1/YccA family protein [Pseudomonadota bacterium]